MFRLTTQNIARLYDTFSSDVTLAINRMRALGMGNDEIISRLGENLDNGKDLFGTFKGALEKELDQIVGVTAQSESNSIYADGQMLRWELDPTVREHCPDCLRNASLPSRSYADWEAMGLPGFGNTECTDYCKCTLVI